MNVPSRVELSILNVNSIRFSQARAGSLFQSSGGTQVERHEALALRFQSLSSIAFEGRLCLVIPTGQIRVVAPEALDAAGCQRAFRLLLQVPPRAQVLAA